MKVLTIGSDKKLFEEGSAVLLRTLEYASQTGEYHVIVFSLRKDGLSPKRIQNVYVHPTNSFSKFSYVFDAVKIGMNLSVNVVSAQDPFESGLAGYRIAKKLGVPLQLQIHTDFLSPYFKNSVLNRIRARIAKYIIPKAQGIRAVSSVIDDSLKKRFPTLRASVDILPVFVDVEKIMNYVPQRNIKTDFPQFEHIILMASRLSGEKRIDTALEVLKEVLKQVPKTGLVIAGDGPEKESLLRRAKELGVGESIVFPGWQDDLISYYKTADVFLLTSEFEGYGMTLVEAGAAGCPVVTTNVGIAQTALFADTVNSYICEVGDIRHIAKHVAHFLSDPTKRELFKKNLQDSIKSTAVSREEYVRKYIPLLQKLL